MNAEIPEKDVDELRELVRRHKVYWEARPEPILDEKGEVVKTGFQLGLRGTFDHPDHPIVAGNPECAEVYRDLRRIAESILPADAGDSFHISEFDNSLDYTPSSGRKDVEVTIRIRDWESADWIDDDETRSLRQLERQLEDLGSPEGRWREKSRRPR